MPEIYSIQSRTKVFLNGQLVPSKVMKVTLPGVQNQVAEIPDGKGGVVNIPTGTKIDGELSITFKNGTELKVIRDWFKDAQTLGVAAKKTVLIEEFDFNDKRTNSTTLNGVYPFMKEGIELDLSENENLAEQTFTFKVDNEA